MIKKNWRGIRLRNKMSIFGFYKKYLEVYPEWYIIKRYMEGEDITLCSDKK